MSVLVMDLEAYEAVYNKALSYQFNRVCNIDYCNTLSEPDERLKKHVKNWLYLNEWSFNRKYEEGNQLPELPEMMKFKSDKPTINTYQMLKYLECIYYNIELDTIKNGRTVHCPKVEIDFYLQSSYDLLKQAIDEIKTTIISTIPEYKKAKWYDV